MNTNGRGQKVRAGGRTLTLLSTPRNFLVLKSLAEGTKGQLDLRRDAGAPAQSTLRNSLDTLEKVGAIERRRRDSFPGTFEYDLAEAGQGLLSVAGGLERWLATAPRGPIELGSSSARAAIKGLVEGWCASVLTTLAAEPLSLTELDKRIAAVSYPTLGRCLDTMRLAEQLEVGDRSPKGTPYALTDWLRRGLSPLALAARWEHSHRPDGVDSIHHSDIDGALLLGRPLFKLPGKVSGVCQLAVKIPGSKKPLRNLGFIQVKGGEISFRGVYSQAKPDAWASGTMDTWFATVIDADTTGLRISGDRQLAKAVFDGVHEALFGDEVRKAGIRAERNETQG
jgi:DNA-binding HxlR family transcriptional regulator